MRLATLSARPDEVEIARAVGHEAMKDVGPVRGCEAAARRPILAVVGAGIEVPIFAGALRPHHPDATGGVLGDRSLVDIGLPGGEAHGLRPARTAGIPCVNMIAAVE